ncbi:MAG: hypothetical protein IKF78_15915 [Atopobiaceae bacterium]|nr:hypothetical protein [Atopobiaceae bacterium]
MPVFREKLTDQKLALRFYEKTPNVAYISLKDYYELMLPQGSMDVERKDDGTFLLTSHTGADPSRNMGKGMGDTAVVDPAKGTPYESRPACVHQHDDHRAGGYGQRVSGRDALRAGFSRGVRQGGSAYNARLREIRNSDVCRR